MASVAMKPEAFAGRGGGFSSSHDLEDVLNIVDERPELAQELAAAPIKLRQAVAAAFPQLLSSQDFGNVLNRTGLRGDSMV